MPQRGEQLGVSFIDRNVRPVTRQTLVEYMIKPVAVCKSVIPNSRNIIREGHACKAGTFIEKIA